MSWTYNSRFQNDERVVSVRDNESFWKAVNVLVDHNVHRLCAVNEQGGIEGVISLSDVINFMVVQPGSHLRDITPPKKHWTRQHTGDMNDKVQRSTSLYRHFVVFSGAPRDSAFKRCEFRARVECEQQCFWIWNQLGSSCGQQSEQLPPLKMIAFSFLLVTFSVFQFPLSPIPQPRRIINRIIISIFHTGDTCLLKHSSERFWLIGIFCPNL